MGEINLAQAASYLLKGHYVILDYRTGVCEGHKSHANICVGCEQMHAAEDGGTIEVVVQDMGAVRTKKVELQGV